MRSRSEEEATTKSRTVRERKHERREKCWLRMSRFIMISQGKFISCLPFDRSVSRSLRGQRRAPIEGKFEGPRRGVNTAIETLEELCTGSSMDQEELIANLVARDLSTVLKLFRTCDVAADERGTFKVREWGCRCRRLVNSDEAGVDLRLCGIKFSNCELDTDVHSLNHLLLDKIL